jgi:hypothetical protein
VYLLIKHLITNHSIVARVKRMLKIHKGKCKGLPVACHEGHRGGVEV